MKTIILCGGLGLRFREYAEDVPKPMAEIGGKPILWHVMKIYSQHGFKDFILCLGYKGDKIKEYFMNEEWRDANFTIKYDNGTKKLRFENNKKEDWAITFVDTGLDTPTAGRIKKIEKYVDGEEFFATYSDGVSDLNIKKLYEFHRQKQKTATITTIMPSTHYGVAAISKDSLIESFREKPNLDFWVNGGFFVFNTGVFDVLREDDVLERRPFEQLAAKKQLAAYQHRGFWTCMDTYKDWTTLNELWNSGKAPWKIW